MKKVVAGLAVAGLVAGGIKFWQYAAAPPVSRSKQEDLQQVLGGRAPRNPTAVPTGEIRYAGKYMSFEYPAKAQVYPLPPAGEGILERVDLEIKNPRLTVVAVVMPGTQRSLDEVSGVRMRKNKADIYAEEQTGVFAKRDGKEKTAFVLSGGRLYTFSITGDDARELAKLWSLVWPTWRAL
jgi:hypothetical protein